MLPVLREALSAARSRLRQHVVAGEETEPVRQEIDDLETQIEAEQQSQADEAAAAERARADAIATASRELADNVLAGLNTRLAAFDIQA